MYTRIHARTHARTNRRIQKPFSHTLRPLYLANKCFSLQTVVVCDTKCHFVNIIFININTTLTTEGVVRVSNLMTSLILDHSHTSRAIYQIILDRSMLVKRRRLC